MKYFRFLIVCIILLTVSASGQEQLEQKQNSISVRTGFLENLELTADSLFQHYMEKLEPVQGGVINVVSSDSIYLLKGYGLADVKTHRPFDPVNTHVMIASVSKLITAAAIFQLIEQGKIQLDQPVNELLKDFSIDNPFSQPVLLRHLMTHTAGIDDYTIGIEARSRNELMPLKDFLEKKLPPVVWEPGRYYNYSNFGVSLLLYIVEAVSGQSFESYLQENLYEPLNMDMSGFAYTDQHESSMMTRYKWKETEIGELYLDDRYGIKYTHRVGAGGFKTTAEDMAAFMQMYLGNGQWKGRSVIGQDIILQGFSQQFSYHEKFNRKIGLIWNIHNHNGLTWYSHSGDDTGIESFLMLIPDADIGFFFASNNNVARRLVRDFQTLILNSIEYAALQVEPAPAGYRSSADYLKLAGSYQYMNDGQGSIEKLTSLFGDLTIVAVDDNNLVVNGHEYVEVDSLLFKRRNDDHLIVFTNDEHGIHCSSGFATYRKLSWFENPSYNLRVMLGCFAVFIMSIVLWSVQIIKRPRSADNTELKFKAIIGLSAFCILMFFVLMGATTQGITLKYGIPWYFWIYFTLPVLGTGVLMYGLFHAPSFFRHKSIRLITKVHTGTVLLCITVCILIYYQYNILGYKF